MVPSCFPGRFELYLAMRRAGKAQVGCWNTDEVRTMTFAKGPASMDFTIRMGRFLHDHYLQGKPAPGVCPPGMYAREYPQH